MAHIECWLCGFVIFRRSRPVILGNPIFCDFQGGRGVRTPCPPTPLNSYMKISNRIFVLTLGLFDLILYVTSKIFQFNRDGSSCVEPVLSLDKCVLLKDHNAVTLVRLEPAPPVLSQALYHCPPFLTLGWGLGLRGNQGDKKIFFQHGHVAYQIDRDNE